MSPASARPLDAAAEALRAASFAAFDQAVLAVIALAVRLTLATAAATGILGREERAETRAAPGPDVG
ncbi:hypothetical protein ACLNGM_00895 [Aureimonas phyllosphaerae]|uniref:hypothetical protein n=1 Tax=Aureimonas phyllosphaerae TaxID=1166078 RepID=UPI003A5C4DA3